MTDVLKRRQTDTWGDGEWDWNHYLQTKGCLGLPETGSGKEESSHRRFRGSKALSTHWCETSRLKNCQSIHFCCLKPPSSWYLVTAALELSHGRVYSKRFVKPSRAKCSWQLESWDHSPINSINLISKNLVKIRKGEEFLHQPYLPLVRGLPQGMLTPAHSWLCKCKSSLAIPSPLMSTGKPIAVPWGAVRRHCGPQCQNACRAAWSTASGNRAGEALRI